MTTVLVVDDQFLIPGLNGIDATERILAQAADPAPRILVLTTFDLDEYVYGALRAGACGFLLKDSARNGCSPRWPRTPPRSCWGSPLGPWTSGWPTSASDRGVGPSGWRFRTRRPASVRAVTPLNGHHPGARMVCQPPSGPLRRGEPAGTGR